MKRDSSSICTWQTVSLVALGLLLVLLLPLAALQQPRGMEGEVIARIVLRLGAHKHQPRHQLLLRTAPLSEDAQREQQAVTHSKTLVTAELQLDVERGSQDEHEQTQQQLATAAFARQAGVAVQLSDGAGDTQKDMQRSLDRDSKKQVHSSLSSTQQEGQQQRTGAAHLAAAAVAQQLAREQATEQVVGERQQQLGTGSEGASAAGPTSAGGAPSWAAPSSWRVLVGLIGRNVAQELPHVLRNVKALAQAAQFARTHVILVENESTDDTVANFTHWMQANPDMHGELRSLPGSGPRSYKSLTVLAEARNVYLDALRDEQTFADVDALLVVDTDMCYPWDVQRMARVMAALTPHVHVLYANGGCGWYEELEGGATGPELHMGHELAVPIYCDLFALRAAGTRRRFSMLDSKVWWKPGTCRGSPATTEGLPCSHLAGHAVVPVDAAFGGWGLYRADVLRSAGRRCRYESQYGAECEHVPLSQCLAEVANATQVIATGLVVDWEGCSRPLLPT